MRVNEDFRVIALGLPVPKYESLIRCCNMFKNNNNVIDIVVIL